MMSLRASVKEYLAMRRALGFKLERYDTRLLDFVAFMQRHHARRITGRWIDKWLQQNSSSLDPNYRALRLCILRGFARYRSAIDSRTEIPPPAGLPRPRGPKRYYLYTDEEIHRLLAETLKPRVGATSISRWVRYTLYGLLSVTGMRIGEALRLDVNDVDLDQGILRFAAQNGASRGWLPCAARHVRR
jgi:integrase